MVCYVQASGRQQMQSNGWKYSLFQKDFVFCPACLEVKELIDLCWLIT